MTFERTPFWQSNRAKFLGVDLVCYVEGDIDSESGDDIMFWSTVFSALRPNLAIRFICKGGKPSLEGLGNDIVNNDINNTIVAMDADYSRHFSGRLIEDSRVLYTFGYSWENDVYFKDHAIGSHIRLARCLQIPQEVFQHYDEIWARLNGQIYWTMLADFHALARNSSVLPRDRPGRVIGRGPDGTPLLRKDQCLILTMAARTITTGRPAKEYLDFPKNPQIHLVGKIVALIARYIAGSGLRMCGITKDVSEQHFKDVSLGIFESSLRNGTENEVTNFHRQQALAV